MSVRLPWPARLRPWRRWIIFVLVVVITRLALPLMLRPIIASQASKALHVRVEVGDVDLALYKLGVVLKEVAVYAATPTADASGGAPTPSATSPAVTPAVTPAATPAATADAPTGSSDATRGAQVLISWQRVEASVRWLPLFKKRVVLRDIELDSPRIAVDRLADGKINLMALLPANAEEPTPSPTPAAAEPKSSGWGFGVDHFSVRDGALRFRDFRVKDSEPIELTIPTVEVTDVYLIPGQYGEPAKASITVAVDQGSLQVEATLVQRSASENQLEAYLKARNLPVRRGRLYIPRVGWSALDGALDADITYNFDTGTQNAVRGSATISDFAVRVAHLDEPALAWKTLTVQLDAIDLLGQRAAVRGIELSGATLLVRPAGGDRFPFLTTAGSDHGRAPGGVPAGAAPAPHPAAAPPQAESAPPWRWVISSVHVADTRVRLLGAAAPVDVGVGLELTDLADHADHLAHIALGLGAGQGTVNVDGALRVAPPAFGGTLKIADLSLPELGVAAAALPKDVLQSARLGADLTIGAGVAATKDAGALPAGDVCVHGKLSLADVRVTPASPPGVSVGVGSLDLSLGDLQVAGVLTADTAAADGAVTAAALPPGDVRMRGTLDVGDLKVTSAGPRGYTLALRSLDAEIADLLAHGAIPTAVKHAPGASPPGGVHVQGKLAFADLTLTGADAKVFAVAVRAVELPFKDVTLPGVIGDTTTTADNRAISVALGDLRVSAPSVRLTRSAAGPVLPDFFGATEDTSPPPVETPQIPAPAVAAPASHVQIAVDSLRLTDGNVGVLDRTVKPFYQGVLSQIGAEVTKLRWPARTIGDLHVAATGAEKGKLDVYGALAPGAGWLQVYIDRFALAPFNPYATTLSGYRIGAGKLSLVSKVSTANDTYDTSNYVTLHNLDVRGGAGESLFQQNFGIPLSLALALMRDTDGNIGLDVPVAVNEEGTKVGIGTVLRGALQRAIMGALVSPLKLVGAVFSADKIESVAPPAIPFLPGRAEFAGSGAQQVDQLAGLLASRPGIGVTLEATVTPADVRWLREQALREEWAGQGMFAKLKDLPDRAARRRVEEALAARARDAEGQLDAADAALLDRWLDERPPMPAERLQGLANARLGRVEEILCRGHGIEAYRVARRDAPADAAAEMPVVRVDLGPAGAPASP